MPWSSIAFAEGFDSANSRWIRTVFQHLYEHVSDDEFDALALYRDVNDLAGVTLYLSPKATSRLRAAMSRFDLVDCERPLAGDVELVIGAPLAARPEWCELSPAARLAEAEAAYAGFEVASPEGDTGPKEVAS